MFLWLSILADEWLASSLEDLSKKLRVPPSVSAATFVAFGSSAPELVISGVGAASDNTELTIPTLLASALLAFGLIPAVVCLEDTAHLRDPVTLVRDSLSFAVPLGLLVWYSTQPTTNLWQSLFLVGLYPLYVALVYLVHTDHPDDDSDDGEDTSYGSLSSPTKAFTVSDLEDINAKVAPSSKKRDSETTKLLVRDDGDDDDDEPGYVRGMLEWPLRTLCQVTIIGGPCQRFLTTLLYVAGLSYAAVYFAETLTRVVGMSHATAGMTLLAFGAQVPDLIAARELARNHHADSGISQAVGSQVINVTLGLGLPYTFYILSSDRHVQTDNNATIVNLSCLVFAMIAIYLLIVGVAVVWAARKKDHDDDVFRTPASLSRVHGGLLLVAFLLLYALGIVSAELRWPHSG